MGNLQRRIRTVESEAPKPSVERVVPQPVEQPQTIAKQKVKRGRPRIEDKGTTLSDTKPWLALGMCRRTWEKRQRELKA